MAKRKKSPAQLDREIASALTKRAKRGAFEGDIHAWAERHDQHAPEDWLHYVLDGTYSVPEMRAAILADRAPRKSGKKSAFRGDVHAWAERHDQYAAEDWLHAVLDGTYAVPEMRAAILADRAPRSMR